MGYRSLQACVADLRRHGHLVDVDAEVNPELEVAEIQRRVFAAGGPALLFHRARGCKFPLLANLFGTQERVRFIFRHTWEAVRQLIALKVDPSQGMRHPLRSLGAARHALHMLPKMVRTGPVLAHPCAIDQVPAIRSWPMDGGAFITLPQVYTEHPLRPGWKHSNLGMYRVQLNGGQYEPNREIGLHYQIHRGIGVHHAAAIEAGKPLKVNIFVGGPPAMTIAAVMPLPEGMSELTFAGALSGRRIRMVRQGEGELPISAEADFCIVGEVVPGKLLPEGPFGDHLGYYSLDHDFPVLRVEKVYHRRDAIWPFTVVGRPPQEDTLFGWLIHELTGPVIPTVLPGVRAVHAVDAAGVHPLLLAVGSERYTPYNPLREPMEILTQANAILGQGQMSLAKYLFIAAEEASGQPDVHDIAGFFQHVLQRVDWRRDLHFQTRTTIDTLDYSGTGLNQGSKAVVAAAGPKQRDLPTELPADLTLPEGFSSPRVALPGVLVISGPKCQPPASGEQRVSDGALERFCAAFDRNAPINRFPLIVVVDDSQFTAATLNNWLWVTFTRSNPATDVHGIESFIADKHWGCHGAMVIDARIKPHHAPPLVEDPEVTRRVDALAARGGPLHGII